MENQPSSGTREVFTDCTLCYHSCGTRVTVEDGRAVKIRGLESHPLNNGRLCPKGASALEIVYSPERLTEPLKKVKGRFQPISWDQALDEIAARLLDLKHRFGPQVLGIFCGSIGVENLEMASLVHRFQAAFGSPNFFSVESVCYRMRIRTRQITFGKYPVEEPDSKLYILWGHNPDQSDFPLKRFLARNRKKGAGLVVIDPKKIPLAEKADMYLRIRPGADGALALALMQVIIAENLQDQGFLDAQTIGFEELAEHVKPFTPEWAEEVTWVKAGDIRKLARWFASTKGASIYQGTCTHDQTANGTQNSRAFSVLQALTGNINVPGGWVTCAFPRFGNMHLGVEGKPLGADQYPIFHELWGRTTPYGVVTMVPEAIPEKLKAFLVVGGNPLLSMPDTHAFTEAFRKLDLLVVQDLFLTATAKEAHYVLPACSHLEKWGVAYTYNVCHSLPYLMLRKQCLEPLGQSWSERRFLVELSQRLGFGGLFPWRSDEELVGFLLKPTGLSFDHLLRVKPEGDFYAQKRYGIPEGHWRTPSGKIELYSETLKEVGFDPLPIHLEPERGPRRGGDRWQKKYPLILSTGSRNLYYTHGQQRQSRTLSRLSPHPLAEIGPATAARFGVEDGDWINIETNRGRVRMKAKVDGTVAEGVVLAPHGWSEEANANLLTDVSCREPIMGYPDMKSLQCAIRKA